jgi:hypothetical protein
MVHPVRLDLAAIAPLFRHNRPLQEGHAQDRLAITRKIVTVFVMKVYVAMQHNRLFGSA